MSKKRNPDQLLLDLARGERQEVVHLPYTEEFEAVCQRITPTATTQEKHQIWEKFLELNGLHSEPSANTASQPIGEISLPPAPPVSESTSSDFGYLSRGPDAQGYLFSNHDSADDFQPWSGPSAPKLSAEQTERRERLLIEVSNSYLAGREQRVADILQRFPETRDSDTALCIKYWKMYQADVIERWQPLELEVLFELDRIETLGRVRRIIQNELRLFRGVEDTHRARNALQVEFHEYLAAHHDSLPEVRFYLDETGNEGHKAYTGIAGLCIINWKQFEKHHAALQQWRTRQGWPETIHFCDMDDEKVGRAVALLRQLQSRRSGLLFLGYSLSSRGRTHEDLFSLFIQLVVDSLRKLRASGSLTGARSVRIIKEAETGFDALFLRKMTKQLSDVIAQEFPGDLTVLPVEAHTKGRTVLLECADLIAGGMQRRALGRGRNRKDLLAEAIINVTGFEDNAEPGTLFRYFASPD